jgi:hypothetical protein
VIKAETMADLVSNHTCVEDRAELVDEQQPVRAR